MGKQLYPVSSKEVLYVSKSKLPKGLEVTKRKVNEFRDGAFIGGLYKGRGKQIVKLLKKYRHIALTDRGTYQWVDLYMFNVKNVDFTETDYIYFERG